MTEAKSATGGDTVRLMGEAEAARYLGMSRSFLRQSRMDGNRNGRTPAPPWIQIGRTVRYDTEDLDRWIVEHRQAPKSPCPC